MTPAGQLLDSSHHDQQIARLSPPRTPTGPVLPRPVASLVSLTVSTCSIGLRIGGFVGKAIISAAKTGTLTGAEVGRVFLEGVLERAGNDIVRPGSQNTNQSPAERLIGQTVCFDCPPYVNGSIVGKIQSDSRKPLGFQLGSTSLDSGLHLSQLLLSALDAVLGDTETSKAIASIAVLLHRQFQTPDTKVQDEQLSFGDFLVGTVGYALLQRWVKSQTEKELENEKVIENVWDIVVVEEDSRSSEDAPSITRENTSRELIDGSIRRRSASFVSATGEKEPFEALEDTASLLSTDTSNPLGHPCNERLHIRGEHAFRQNLEDQLRPGTHVRLTAQSEVTDTIYVEISQGNLSNIDPPPGFTLVSIDEGRTDGVSTVQFQRKRGKRRRGSFDTGNIVLSTNEQCSPQFEDRNGPGDRNGQTNLNPRLSLQPAPLTLELESDNIAHGEDPSATTLIQANQKRSRIPLHSHHQFGQSNSHPEVPERNELSRLSSVPTDADAKTSIRKALSKGKSVKGLVDFWNKDHRNQKRHSSNKSCPLREGCGEIVTSRVPKPVTQLAETSETKTPPTTRDELAMRGRPSLVRNHRRNKSSVYSNISIASDTSIVLRSDFAIDGEECVVPSLRRHGRLSGSYPHKRFAINVSRFSTFAVAAYGQKFLRLLVGNQRPNDTNTRLTDLPEHCSFSSYIGLPASTVLLSSFVDTQLESNSSQPSSGFPLVHYISVDHDSQAVVLTCRGTLGFEDILTDMTGDYDQIEWLGNIYGVHQGVYASAKRILTTHGGRVLATLKAALEEFAPYGLVFCGHSLGGSVATILAMLLAHPNTSKEGSASNFVTAFHTLGENLCQLPFNRPTHVYAYGPAASVSPSLQFATKGLVTTIIHSQDVIPYLSLGMLKDAQAICLTFKTDARDARGKVRRRVWEALSQEFRNRTEFAGLQTFLAQEWFQKELEDDYDQWSWTVMQSLRECMGAPKLVPPGDVFIVESSPVLQRHAFVQPTRDKSTKLDNRSYRPAARVILTYVNDVERRFREFRFGRGMFIDHFPARYEKVLKVLEQGVGGI